MDITELIRLQDEQIAAAASEANAAAIRANEAVAIAEEKRQHLDKLRTQRLTLEEVARGFGQLEDIPQSGNAVRNAIAEGVEEWRAMNRLDAVERVLSESSSPLHITEIETALKFKGRTDDSYTSISASLAHLKRVRSSVVSVGQGRWEFVRAGTNASGHPPYPVQLGVSDDMARILSGGPHPEGDIDTYQAIEDGSGVHVSY